MASLSRQIKRTKVKRSKRENLNGSKSLERSLLRLQNLGAGIGGALVLLSAPAIAQAGDGFTVSVDGDTTTYEQTAQKVYNRVDSYNIGMEETHIYNQPGADSVFLQRVTGADPSSILGQLTANGQVWIMNPSGVLFGSRARINTAGFIASSLVMGEDDFFAGRYNLTQEGSGGYVVNKGTIDVKNGGYAILAGASVVNDGTIKADDGEVVIAAGRKMSFDFDGDGMIVYAVDEAVAARIVGPDGADLTSAVLNAGNISGAKVAMTAKAARTVFDAVVNNTGVIEAKSVSTEGGVIKLLGGDEGNVINTGTLDASGAASGGTVVMSGEKVGTAGQIRVDAVSGDAGSIELTSTVKTAAADGALLSASSASGAGGNVIIKSQGDAILAQNAHIDISGGTYGGFAELSGAQGIYLEGTVDGAGGIDDGTFLIDPTVLWIVDKSAAPGSLDGSLPDIL